MVQGSLSAGVAVISSKQRSLSWEQYVNSSVTLPSPPPLSFSTSSFIPSFGESGKLDGAKYLFFLQKVVLIILLENESTMRGLSAGCYLKADAALKKRKIYVQASHGMINWVWTNSHSGGEYRH